MCPLSLHFYTDKSYQCLQKIFLLTVFIYSTWLQITLEKQEHTTVFLYRSDDHREPDIKEKFSSLRF